MRIDLLTILSFACACFHAHRSAIEMMSSVESSAENLVIVSDKVALRASNLPPGEAVDKHIGGWSLLSKASRSISSVMGAQAKGELILVIQNTESGESVLDGTCFFSP